MTARHQFSRAPPMPSATADSNTEIRLQEYLSVCPNIHFSSKSPIKNKSFIPGPFSNRKIAFSENRPGFHKTCCDRLGISTWDPLVVDLWIC